MPRVAVVGTGFGCRVHVPALRAAGFDVVALVGQDRDRTERRAGRAGVAGACTSLREALDLHVDAVTIAAPPDQHSPLTLEALAAGAHVLCEKPFALDVDAAEALAAAAARANRVGLVAHEFRFAPERRLVAQLLRDDAIGAPRLATLLQHLDLVADRATPVPSWWFDSAQGGGWLGASGSHTIDQVRHWLGDIAAVRSSSLLCRGADADDGFVGHLTTASGCEVTIEQCAAAWGPPLDVARVVGERGTLWIDRSHRVWLASADDREGRCLLDPPASAASDDPRQRFTHLELGPFTDLCRCFADAIGGNGSSDAATFADGVAVQRVIDIIRAGRG
ncbi:MAG TPA: Gfo/Idh/MocA family oxidoreductase [Acidimicrobiales bacterium]|jgi:predicted dehydrogenase|nr:Gfo/Idh/MocA family oxidoreductase [Acidimicrobiales bacterium]